MLAKKVRPAWKVPLPLPKSMLTLPPFRLAVSKSGWSSPLKSATAVKIGLEPTVKVFRAWKVPSPLASRRLTVLAEKLLTARSGLPSPLTSATAGKDGLAPAENVRPA